MTLAHFHLATNHLPIIGFPILLVLLLAGALLKKEQLQSAAVIGFVVIALLTIPVYLTGENAEELVENIPGVLKENIERHEFAATVSFVAVLITGALSLLCLAMNKIKSSWKIASIKLVIVAAIASSGFLAWTAFQGGKIRHTELEQATIAAQVEKRAGNLN